jgi:hypothetical protein
MSMIVDMRKQTAVYWKRNPTPDEFGAFTFEDPIEIKCRWVDQIGEFRNAKAEALNSKAVVYVDRPMDVEDMLMKGDLETTTPLDPRGLKDAFKVIAFGDTPDLDNFEHLYTAYL